MSQTVKSKRRLHSGTLTSPIGPILRKIKDKAANALGRGYLVVDKLLLQQPFRGSIGSNVYPSQAPPFHTNMVTSGSKNSQYAKLKTLKQKYCVINSSHSEVFTIIKSALQGLTCDMC